MKRVSLIVAGAFALVLLVSLGFTWPFGTANDELTLPGVVEVHEIRLGSKVGGRVAEVLVREGQEVTADTELVRFAAPELTAQKKQLEYRLKAAQADERKAKIGPRPLEKDEAKALDAAAKAKAEKTRAGWRHEMKRQADLELEVAEAELTLAQQNFARVDEKKSEVSRSELDNAVASLKVAASKHKIAKIKTEMVKQGGWQHEIDEAKAEQKRTQAHVELLEEGTRAEDKEIAEYLVRELEAKLDEVKAHLAESVVKAPARMIVEVLAVRNGDLVPPNAPIVRALHVDDRWVKVFVPATQLGKLRHGQAVEVTCDSYPKKRFPGKIIQIATISEFTPRNVQTAEEREHQVFGVKVQVDDDGLVFKPGMAAEVKVSLAAAPK